jgi:hypothetical protein
VLQTITTVGYGDVNPVNTAERVFVIVAMLFGVFAFSIISGALASLMTSFDEKEGEEHLLYGRLAELRDLFKIDTETYEKLKKNMYRFDDRIETKKFEIKWIIDSLEFDKKLKITVQQYVFKEYEIFDFFNNMHVRDRYEVLYFLTNIFQ